MAKKRVPCSPGRESREAKLQRLTELIRRNEYVVDEELLADAILKHLGPKTRQRRPPPRGRR